jgi:hypothetical protein
VQILNNVMSDNVPRVGDVALSPTRANGHVAERRGVASRRPRHLPRRRCAYALSSDVTLLSVPALASIDDAEFSCAPESLARSEPRRTALRRSKDARRASTATRCYDNYDEIGLVFAHSTICFSSGLSLEPSAAYQCLISSRGMQLAA